MSVKESIGYYQKNKRQFLKLFSEGTNFKIHSCEFYESEGAFKKLEENIDSYFELEGGNYISGMTIEKEVMRSIVENPDKTILKIHDSLTIFLECGSHIRFSPYKTDSIEITRVMVRSDNRHKGIGSQLMSLVLKFIHDTLGYYPKMFLECTGSVGFHPDNSSSISIQTAFFRKHGFRVENRKHYPRYVTMMRPEEDSNSNLFPLF
jgi:GNAT superfamily N-acetyltransferase